MGRYYPVMLDLVGVECLVVGGGRVAERKVEGLLSVGARVTVIAPHVSDRIAELSETGKVRHELRTFAAGDTSGYRMLIAATDDARLNAEAAEEARRQGLLVNVVDCAPESNFIVPAVVRRGDLVLAVSTGGASPAQARQIREGLEGDFGPEWGPYLALLEELRPQVLASWPAGPAREALFKRIASSGLRKRLAVGDEDGAKAEIAECLGESGRVLEEAIAPAVGRAVAAISALTAARKPAVGEEEH